MTTFVHRDPEEPIVLAAGLRTPQVRAGGAFAGEDAGHLGSALVRELLVREELDGRELDEVLFGCALPPHDQSNVARVIARRAGLPDSVPARTVDRGGGSGLEAVTAAITSLRAGAASAVLCGGVEVMSAYPLLMGPELTELYERLARTRSPGAALEVWSDFRPAWLARPRSTAAERRDDPVTGRGAGVVAEGLAREFDLSREDADAFAARSHHRAARARDAGRFEDEILPWLPLGARSGARAVRFDLSIDDGPVLGALAELPAHFVRPDGTVTAGNSAGDGDGATALLVTTAARARELELEPLARLKAFAWVGVDRAREGLSPVFAVARALELGGVKLDDLDVVELDEAYAAQVLACGEALASERFAREALGGGSAPGELDPERLNRDGGALALDRPAGAAGARLVLAAARRLRREDGELGLVALDAGGGLGGALILERSLR